MVDSVLKYLKTPEWRRQHRWRRAIWMTMSSLGLTGMHALPVNRRWIDIHHRPMPMRGLDPKLAGMKIVHISDIHYSPVVWRRYLVQYVHWINDLKPDLVVVTGDLITGGYQFGEKIAKLFSHLKTRHGVVCSFGNHDYGIYGKNHRAEGERRADHLEKCLAKQGIIVLRNHSLFVHAEGSKHPLVIVGLDDEWSGHMDAERAFAGLNGSFPTICLNHNPANCTQLIQYPWHWMLSGHTHGRQIASSRFGKTFYPKHFRHYTHGYYCVSGRHLYVNRGLSYGQRMLEWCRPEVTVFKLQCQEDM